MYFKAKFSTNKRVTLIIALLCLWSCGQASQNSEENKLVEFIDPYKEIRNKVIKINFQPEGAPTVDGYLVDSGKPYGKRDNGLFYGWSQDVSKGLRDRNNFRSLNQIYETFAHFILEKENINANWELALPNGVYVVRLAEGDISYPNKNLDLIVEGQVVIDHKRAKYGYFASEIEVKVLDGKLTISKSPISKGYFPKISFIEVLPKGELHAFPPPNSIKSLKQIHLDDSRFIYWKNSHFNFDTNYLITSPEPLTEYIEKISNYNLNRFMLRKIGKASNTIISASNMEYNYIVSVSKDGIASTPKFIPPYSKQTPITSQKLKKNLVKAMETTKRWTTPEDIFLLHNKFSEHLYTHKTGVIYNKVIPESIWQHASLNSAVIALQTEKVSTTYIKYWNERTSQQTLPSDRPVYTHIHQLKDLTPNTTYHFELIASSDKKVLHQGTVSTLSNEKVKPVYITQDTTYPIKLSQPNTTYILQDNIVAESAFLIASDNISLDLNGFCLKQINEKYGDSPPVIKTSAMLNEFSLYNGCLIQSEYGSTKNKKLIEINNVIEVEIAGISLEYSLPQTIAINVSAKKTEKLPYRHNIHHNILIDKGWEIENRHGYGGSVPIRFDNNFGYYESSIEASYNLILRSRQNGIQAANYSHHNEIYIDSWSTNSFAIQPFGTLGKVAGRSHDNKIFLTGYHAIGFGWSSNNLLIENNYIEMQGINSRNNRWWENFGDQNSLNGLRITNYDKGGQIRINHKYYRNKIIGMARNGSMMRGTELYSDYSISGTEVRWSEIDIRAEDEESTDVSAVVTQGTPNKNHQETLYKDSVLRSNVAIVRFGDSYGRGNNHIFENVIFEKVQSHGNFHTFVFDGGFSNSGHIIKHCSFENGANWNDVYWKKTGTTSFYSVINQNIIKEVRPYEWKPVNPPLIEVRHKKKHQVLSIDTME